MSSNITINISAQEEEAAMEKQQEAADSVPAPPESEDFSDAGVTGETTNVSAAPTPPQNTASESDLMTDEPADPPKHSDETTDSASSDMSGMPPVPPSDHPAISEDDTNAETTENGNGDSPAPPEDYDDGEQEKG